MWGQGAVSICHKLAPGIIPTRVGTREKHWLSSTKHRDHPHACGDKLLPQILYKGGGRIIPTRVGTRVCYLGFVCLCQDHPHAYGDKSLLPWVCLPLPGSSPRVWGQAAKFNAKRNVEGIIPTRMGTSACHK